MHLRFSFLFVALLLLSPIHALGAEDSDLLGVKYGAEAGLSRQDPRITVAQVIQVALGLLGIVALAFIVYAGFLWLTSGGNEEQVTHARQTIFRAVIGILIIFSAYAITTFVVRQLYRATSGYNYVERPGIL